MLEFSRSSAGQVCPITFQSLLHDYNRLESHLVRSGHLMKTKFATTLNYDGCSFVTGDNFTKAIWKNTTLVSCYIATMASRNYLQL